MKQTLIYFLFFLLTGLPSCASREHTEYEQVWEGFAGHPDSLRQRPYEYYYFRTKGKVSSSLVLASSEENIRTSCIVSATKKQKSKLLERIISESVLGGSCGEYGDDAEKLVLKSVKVLSKELDEIHPMVCKPSNVLNPTNTKLDWKKCECIIYFYIPGGRDRIVATVMSIDRN